MLGGWLKGSTRKRLWRKNRKLNECLNQWFQVIHSIMEIKGIQFRKSLFIKEMGKERRQCNTFSVHTFKSNGIVTFNLNQIINLLRFSSVSPGKRRQSTSSTVNWTGTSVHPRETTWSVIVAHWSGTWRARQPTMSCCSIWSRRCWSTSQAKG